eukprot:1539345-Prymnesium_polylepis.2
MGRSDADLTSDAHPSPSRALSHASSFSRRTYGLCMVPRRPPPEASRQSSPTAVRSIKRRRATKASSRTV